MNKFQQFGYWWYKNVLGYINDSNDKLTLLIGSMLLLSLLVAMFIMSITHIPMYILFSILIPFILTSFYSTLFAEKCNFEDEIEYDKRTDKINNILNE